MRVVFLCVCELFIEILTRCIKRIYSFSGTGVLRACAFLLYEARIRFIEIDNCARIDACVNLSQLFLDNIKFL